MFNFRTLNVYSSCFAQSAAVCCVCLAAECLLDAVVLISCLHNMCVQDVYTRGRAVALGCQETKVPALGGLC